MNLPLIITTAITGVMLSLVTPQPVTSTIKTITTSPNAWEVLGSRSVRYGTDKDVITVSDDKWYKGIYFKVTEAPIKINDMKVYFDNGDKFDVSMRSMIKQNGHTRTIELPGGERRITKVEFSYETMGSNRGNATLTLWGKY
jgi:hypothetical protein